MAKFNYEVLADDVKQRIQELQAAAADLTPAWKAVGSALVNRIRMGFRFSKDPWGNTWLPIKYRAPRIAVRAMKQQDGKTRYVRKRNADGKLVLTAIGTKQVTANASGKAGQPLVDKGNLRRSIVANATQSGVEVGTNLKYAKIHHFGGVIKPKNRPFLVFPGPTGEMIFAKRVTIPARPYMPINQAGDISLPTTWAQNILRTLAAHFGLEQKVPA